MKDLLKYIEEELSIFDRQPNILTPDDEDFEDIKASFGSPTLYNNVNFTSSVQSPATAQTVILASEDPWSAGYTKTKKDIRDNAKTTLAKVFEYLRKCPVLLCQGRECDNEEWTLECDLYISYYRKEAAHLCCMFREMAFPVTGRENDRLKVICIPEWNEKDRQVLCIPELGVTFILGSDYYEEIKNAFLRMSIYRAKEKGYLPLHAATKIVTTEEKDRTKKVGIVIFGINRAGKTTHTLHDHGFSGTGENVRILQDDLVFFTQEGTLLGSERGFYISCSALSGSSQPLLYNCATMPGVILENVMVDFRGKIYFEDKTVTGNSHAVINRNLLDAYTDGSVNMPDLDRLDELIFIFMSKNFTVVPIISRLTPEQAAACYMLSEPFDAMASEFGKCDGKNELASMPQGVGNNAEDINLFYSILKKYENKIECFMINNGGVGELVETGIDGTRKMRKKVTRVSIPEISQVIRGLVKKNIEWEDHPDWLVKVPKYIEGMNIEKYRLSDYYTQEKADILISRIRKERRAFAENYQGLDENILNATEF
ncbi:MAG: phosphoenolpyruvate carboxykinase (ATP) [Armatimonadetes bacterium]|nr:phosphoenolpyruvate carboxykinase (ATP) [Candidatus Hippobium faecium]